jgi:hypothetical protein
VIGGLAYAVLAMPAVGAGPVTLWASGPGGIPFQAATPSSLDHGGMPWDLRVDDSAASIRVTGSDTRLADVIGRSSYPVPTLSTTVATAGGASAQSTPDTQAAVVISRPRQAPATGGSSMEIGLSRAAAWRQLSFNAGAVELNGDLWDLSVSAVAVDTGIGSVDLTLGARSDCSVDVEGGIGSVTLRVPRGATVTLVDKGGLVARDLPGFVPGEGVWRRQGEGALESGLGPPTNVTATVGLGIGSVSIVTY